MENIPEEDDEKPFRHFINKQVGDDGDDGDDDDDDDDSDDDDDDDGEDDAGDDDDGDENIPEEDDEKSFRHFINKQVDHPINSILKHSLEKHQSP